MGWTDDHDDTKKFWWGVEKNPTYFVLYLSVYAICWWKTEKLFITLKIATADGTNVFSHLRFTTFFHASNENGYNSILREMARGTSLKREYEFPTLIQHFLHELNNFFSHLQHSHVYMYMKYSCKLSSNSKMEKDLLTLMLLYCVTNIVSAPQNITCSVCAIVVKKRDTTVIPLFFRESDCVNENAKIFLSNFLSLKTP